MAGLKSTALRFGENTKPWALGFYGGALLLWAAAALLAGGGAVMLVAMGAVAAMLMWQVASLDINDADNCLRRFKANREVGWVLFGGIVAEMALRSL